MTNSILISTLIFDVDGVLTFAKFSDVYFDVEKRLKLPEGCLHSFYTANLDGVLRGTVSPRRMADMLSVRYDDLVREWLGAYLSVVKKNDSLLSGLLGLNGEYRLSIITDVEELRVRADRQLNLYDCFNDVVTSCDEGLLKSEPAFFELFLERTGLQASECVFIDDREKNVCVARATGLEGIVYQNNAQLCADLEKFGVDLFIE